MLRELQKTIRRCMERSRSTGTQSQRGLFGAVYLRMSDYGGPEVYAGWEYFFHCDVCALFRSQPDCQQSQIAELCDCSRRVARDHEMDDLVARLNSAMQNVASMVVQVNQYHPRSKNITQLLQSNSTSFVYECYIDHVENTISMKVCLLITHF